MDAGALLQLAGQFGPLGLFVGYLIWRELRTEKAAREREAAAAELAEKRIEADKGLATALALLRATIEGMR